MCCGAKIAEAELADNCKKERQLDTRENQGGLQLKREGLGMAKEVSKSSCIRGLLRVQPLRRVSGRDLNQHGGEAVMVPRAAREQSQGKGASSLAGMAEVPLSSPSSSCALG